MNLHESARVRLFDELIALHGGSLEMSRFPRDTQSLFMRLLSVSTLGVPEEIHFVVVADGTFKAFAWASGDLEIIVIHYGMITCIVDLFYQVAREMSESLALEEFKPAARTLAGRLRTEDTLVDYGWVPPHLSAEMTTFQQALAAALVTTSLYYIVSHEIAHITLGHLEYIHERDPRADATVSLFERADPDGSVLSFPERQALETLADRWAGQRTLSFIIALGKTHAAGKNDSIEILANKYYAYSVYMIATSISTYLIGIAEGGPSPTETSHPHPEARYDSLAAGLLEMIPTESEEFAIVREGIVRAEPAIHQIRTLLAGHAKLFAYLMEAKVADEKLDESNRMLQVLNEKTRQCAERRWARIESGRAYQS